MENVQLVLSGGNGRGSDVSLCWSAEEGVHSLFLGLALIQRLPGNREHVLHKLAVAQLVNANLSVRGLAREFHHSPRTMKKWAEAVLTGDLDVIAAAFTGQGAEKKVLPPIEEFVRGQYLALREVYPDFRKRIAGAVLKRFGEGLSGERLRQVFRQVDSEAGGPAQRTVPEADGVDRERDAVPAESAPPLSAEGDAECDKGNGTSPSEAPHEQRSEAACDVVDRAPPVSSGTAVCGSVETTSCVQRPLSSTNVAAPRNYSDAPQLSPTPVRIGLPISGFDPRAEPFVVHHARQVLFSPFLDVLGVGAGQAWSMQKQWLVQILQGAVNIEQSKTLCASSLSLLCGGCGAGRDAQRRELKRQAHPDIAQGLFGSGTRLVRDGPGVGTVFYYDVHSAEYTGGESILKGWAGARRGVRKVLHMDFIHTCSGDPCFVFHADNYYDLRERVFMVVDRFNELCDGPGKWGRTWIIDRGVFGLDPFAGFRQLGDSLITWEKDYKRNGWDDSKPAVLFRRCRERNGPRKLLWWQFTCQESPWHRDRSVRRIIVRVQTPDGATGEVAVLCTNPRMAIEQAATLIFNRWIQENDFWYLDSYMGIGQITSYASDSYAQIADTLRDRPMDCPEYREMKKRCTSQERQLGKLLLAQRRRDDRIEQAEAELDAAVQASYKVIDDIRALLPRATDADGSAAVFGQIERLSDRMHELRKERAKLRRRLTARQNAWIKAEIRIRPLQRDNDALRRTMEQALKSDSRIRLLVLSNYRRLDTRAKAVMDALRMTARNVFYRLLETFRPIYRNYRDDHVILRELTHASGVLRRTPGSEIIEVESRPKGSYSQSVRQRIERFLELMTNQINGHFEGRAAPVRITLAENAAGPVG